MPKRDRPEFYYDEKKKLYRKRVEVDGKPKDVYGKTPPGDQGEDIRADGGPEDGARPRR